MEDAVHPIDLQVGRRITERRSELGLVRRQLAEAVGLTFQQIQKYESGANRVSASKLWEIAGFLEAPISYFFSGAQHPLHGPPEPLGRRAILIASAANRLNAHAQDIILDLLKELETKAVDR